MTADISSARAINILAIAFLPLTCKAETFDHSRFVRFDVLDDQLNDIFSLELNATGYGTTASLEATILQLRLRLEHKGHRLDKWAMPSDG